MANYAIVGTEYNKTILKQFLNWKPTTIPVYVQSYNAAFPTSYLDPNDVISVNFERVDNIVTMNIKNVSIGNNTNGAFGNCVAVVYFNESAVNASGQGIPNWAFPDFKANCGPAFPVINAQTWFICGRSIEEETPANREFAYMGGFLAPQNDAIHWQCRVSIGTNSIADNNALTVTVNPGDANAFQSITLKYIGIQI